MRVPTLRQALISNSKPKTGLRFGGPNETMATRAAGPREIPASNVAATTVPEDRIDKISRQLEESHDWLLWGLYGLDIRTQEILDNQERMMKMLNTMQTQLQGTETGSGSKSMGRATRGGLDIDA